MQAPNKLYTGFMDDNTKAIIHYFNSVATGGAFQFL